MNVPNQPATSPRNRTQPPHSRNVALARTSVALDERRSSRRMRTSSPAAATMLTSPNPASATSACVRIGSPVSQLASCGAGEDERQRRQPAPGAEQRDGRRADQGHRDERERQRASGEAPMTGGAINAAMSPKAATSTGVVPDRDRGGGDGRDQRPGQADLGRTSP